MAFLSIVVPVYNKEKYIDNCIQSILSQTFTDFELILVNDGSTDSSGLKCDYYKNSDSRVIVIHQKNQGVSAARNAGLDIVSGTYVGFVDSDDAPEKDMYETLIKSAINFEADIAICGVRQIFPDKIKLVFGTNTVKTFDRDAGISGFFNKEFLGSVFDKIYKTETVKNIRFEGRFYEDLFYNFLAFKEATKTVFNDVIRYNYIISDNSASISQFSRKHLDTIVFSKKIVDITSKELPGHLQEAKTLDLVMNISLLNLILLAGKNTYLKEYEMVVNNLNSYSDFLKHTNEIKVKHRYAYNLFKLSPWLYTHIMRLYCFIMDAKAIERTKKNTLN